MQRAMPGKSPGIPPNCASLRSPVSVQRRGAHKDGRGVCNRVSGRIIAASGIRPDGGNDGVTTVAVVENCIRTWRKSQRVDARAAEQKCCRQLEEKVRSTAFAAALDL